MKVLHLPTPVGGHNWGLSQAEKSLGIDSTVLVTHNNWLNYKNDICLELENKNKLFQIYMRIKTFFNVRKEYDIYHFNFGTSLVDFNIYKVFLWDLPFYRGKKIMTYNGCDIRQKFPTMERTDFSACHQKDCYNGLCNSGKQDKIRKIKIKKVQKYVDHIFALNPDLMYFLPKDKTSFLPYSIAGWDDIPICEYKIKDKIKIVHAPTNRAAKGSKFILKALDNLKNKYTNIEIILVENLSYDEALKKYREADIVIDQVLIGWYGGFGVEVMKMGKPLGVFIREEDLKFIPNQMAEDLKEAIININPYNIEDVLTSYLDNTDLLYKKSKMGLAYVNKWHDPKYVASLTKKVYESI